MTTFGAQKYLWGNIPALDIMKIDQNEGPTYNEDLGMCFAGESSLLSSDVVLKLDMSIW